MEALESKMDDAVATRAVKATARQGSRVWFAVLMLAFGLWLVWDDPIHLWTYRKLPAAYGAWILASWITRTITFRDSAKSTEWPGALVNFGIQISTALIIHAVM